jgi:glutamine synthetase
MEYRHIHVSLRDSNGKNVFAVSDAEKKSGRDGAANKDVKFMSQEGEWFLAGVLDGIADGTHMFSVKFGFLAD